MLVSRSTGFHSSRLCRLFGVELPKDDPLGNQAAVQRSIKQRVYAHQALDDALKEHMTAVLPQLQVNWCTRQGPDCLRAFNHELKIQGAIESLREPRMKHAVKVDLERCQSRKWDELTTYVRCAPLPSLKPFQHEPALKDFFIEVTLRNFEQDVTGTRFCRFARWLVHRRQI